MPYGRLEIFDVQPEIAFSYVAEKRGTEPFPVGALLEAVPVGSIAHLISKDWWQWEDLASLAPGVEEIEEDLHRVDPWDEAGVACLRLANTGKLLKSRGAGLVNRIYAALYNALRDAFRRELVAQVAPEEFVVVIRQDTAEIKERLEAVAEDVEESHDSLPMVSIGVFLQTFTDFDEEDSPTFEHALILAESALSLAIRRQARLIEFGTGTPGSLLNILRRNKEYEELDKTYEALRKTDIRSAQMEGERAVASFVRGDYKTALEINERALELNPEGRVTLLNKATILVAAGKGLAAAEIFSECPAKEDENPIYQAARVMAETSYP